MKGKKGSSTSMGNEKGIVMEDEQKSFSAEEIDENKDNAPRSEFSDIDNGGIDQIATMTLLNELKEENTALKYKMARLADELKLSIANREIEKKELEKYGIVSFVRSVFAPIEDLGSFAAFIPEETKEDPNIKVILNGISMGMKNILNAANEFGVEKICPDSGGKFDPTTHQAVAFEASDFPKGSIIKVRRSGYKIYERLVSPAMVVVSSGQGGDDT